MAAIGAGVVLAAAAFGARSAGTEDIEPIAFLAAGVKPKQLPRHESVPVEFWVSGDLSNVTSGVPPALRKVILAIDSAGSLETTGLPVCPRRRLQSMKKAVVEAACRDAIVGRGTGEVLIAYPENAPMPAASDLLLVNGGVKGRVATFFIWGAITMPIHEVVISTVKIEQVDQGRYGLRAAVRIPPIADRHGSATAFSLQMRKRYGYKGKGHSVFSARCADGRLQARATMRFEDKSSLLGIALSTCGSKR